MLSMPACCWLCLMPLALYQQGICSICYRRLCRSDPVCPRCGLPSANEKTDCGRCLLRPPPWLTLVSVSDYHPPLSVLVCRFKFRQMTALSTVLSRLMLLSWLQQRRNQQLSRPQLVLAVPLHSRRLWQRGFNQADLLARKLARWIGCDYRADGIRRIKAGKVQHRLHASARRVNLRGAFTLTLSVQGYHVALIDDVVTTGSTAREISRLLLNAGAASVQVLCLCRTL